MQCRNQRQSRKDENDLDAPLVDKGQLHTQDSKPAKVRSQGYFKDHLQISGHEQQHFVFLGVHIPWIIRLLDDTTSVSTAVKMVTEA